MLWSKRLVRRWRIGEGEIRQKKVEAAASTFLLSWVYSHLGAGAYRTELFFAFDHEVVCDHHLH